MGDLKGLLNKEGIDFDSDITPESDPDSIMDENFTPPQLPTLDGTITVEDHNDSSTIDLAEYIADIEDEQFDILDFTNTAKELEEKVESITEPEHLYQFEQQEAENIQIEKIKINLMNKLSKQIELSVDELKIKLLKSIKNEIDEFFKK